MEAHMSKNEADMQEKLQALCKRRGIAEHQHPDGMNKGNCDKIQKQERNEKIDKMLTSITSVHKIFLFIAIIIRLIIENNRIPFLFYFSVITVINNIFHKNYNSINITADTKYMIKSDFCTYA